MEKNFFVILAVLRTIEGIAKACISCGTSAKPGKNLGARSHHLSQRQHRGRIPGRERERSTK
jgi:hypothetical protein